MRERDLFLALLDVPEAQRAALLDCECAGDVELRGRVERLLHSHQEAGSFLDLPAAQDETKALPPEAEADQATKSLGDEGDEDAADALAFLEPSPRPDSLGRLGHYEVLEVLGKGGFGIVFRAFDETLQRVVAVKVLAPSLAVTSPARKRFLREARSLAMVRHENVVQVFAVEERPLPHLVMEFVPGETLQGRIDRTGPLDVVEVLRIGRQIAEGLDAAHEKTLIHRDVKPSNVLIDSGPQQLVKLTDFGLARAADDASLTRSGVMAGTPLYAAPEQARGEPLDRRADLFSLGSVLYVMLTGRPPFRANGTMAILKRVCDDVARPIREVMPEVPEWLCRIVEQLHAKSAADRYQTAREVADVLAGCETQLTKHGALLDYARIPGGKPRRRRWLGWAVAATVVVVSMTLAWACVPADVYNRLAGRKRSPMQEAKPAGAFVVLSRQNERTFATLAEAVEDAPAGGAIEIRGNGPFVTAGVSIDRALTIRAGEGFAPVLSYDKEEIASGLLWAKAPLRLEGLTLCNAANHDKRRRALVFVDGKPFVAANCRFVSTSGLCVTRKSPLVECRNCEFYSAWNMAAALDWSAAPPDGVLRMTNCVTPNWGLFLAPSEPIQETFEIELTDNSLTGAYLLSCYSGGAVADLLKPEPKRFRIAATNNLLLCRQLFRVEMNPSRCVIAEWPVQRVDLLASALFAWKGQGNATLPASGYELWHFDGKDRIGRAFKNAEAWKQLWGTDDKSRLRVEAGAVLEPASLAKMARSPELMTPADFRVKQDSPVKGKGGKDPGADVDVVGPGAAFARWKQTPACEAWRRKTEGLMQAE